MCVFFYILLSQAHALTRDCVCLLFVCFVKKNVRCAIRTTTKIKRNYVSTDRIALFVSSHHRTAHNFKQNDFSFRSFPNCTSVCCMLIESAVTEMCSMFIVNHIHGQRMQEERTAWKSLSHKRTHTCTHTQRHATIAEAADEESNASTFNLLFYFIFFLPECATKMWERSEKNKTHTEKQIHFEMWMLTKNEFEATERTTRTHIPA